MGRISELTSFSSVFITRDVRATDLNSFNCFGLFVLQMGMTVEIFQAVGIRPGTIPTPESESESFGVNLVELELESESFGVESES